ncbi:hypothetical protein [Paraburkholderia phosphatilytica]|uniref:hypothetical protein n=1 Tax=Paraburkholderia phosphatilytica TaxID=2282883 RepID=UPI000E493D80|nr:hypothetical protein [Paraburkholderia phosphatilytica]
MKWLPLDIAELKHKEAPSIWFGVAASFAIYVATFVLTILIWKQGEPVICAGFFVRVLLLPALFSAGVISLIYLPHELSQQHVQYWNSARTRMHTIWRCWAQQRVAILGSVALTPEKDVAERMLGLEGSAPANANKMLPIVLDDPESSEPRVARIVQQLVEPFASRLSKIIGKREFSVIVQSERKEDVDHVRALLRTLNPREADYVKIVWSEKPLDIGLVDKWITEGPTPDYCLVLAWQLHKAKAEPTCSEAAVSALFASSETVANSRGTLNPDAWLFRPVPAANDTVFDKLKILLEARQVPTERIKHLWLTHLPGSGKHAAISALKDTELEVAVHDVDAAIGVPGPVNALLAQVLATRMVQHGQGTHLLATPHEDGLMLNLVGKSLAPIAPVADRPRIFVSVWTTIAICSVVGVIVLWLIMSNASMGWFVGALAFFIVLMGLEVLYNLLDPLVVEDEVLKSLPW